MLAGVASDIARYLNVDATLVRIGVAVLTLLTGAGAALYIAAWLLIPATAKPVGRRGVAGQPPGTASANPAPS